MRHYSEHFIFHQVICFSQVIYVSVSYKLGNKGWHDKVDPLSLPFCRWRNWGMMTLSNLPKVTPLVSVIAKQSSAQVWVFIMATHPMPIALLPIMTFLCLRWDKLLMRLDALRGHLSPASAQGKLGLLFFPLAALLCSCPPYSAHPVTLQWLVHESVSSSERAGSWLAPLVFPEDSTVPGTQRT